MPEVKVTVGGRSYEVACQEGEEAFLNSAARMLDAESAALGAQISRIPENRVLLMAGLMLADRTAGLEDQIRALEARLTAAEAEALRPAAAPQRIEVPVIPLAVTDTLAALAAQAEALAEVAEARVN